MVDHESSLIFVARDQRHPYVADPSETQSVHEVEARESSSRQNYAMLTPGSALVLNLGATEPPWGKGSRSSLRRLKAKVVDTHSAG